MAKNLSYLDVKEFIDRLMEDRESSDLEFKSAAGGFPGSIWETYSAFANTEGGTIVLGIKERHGVFSVDNLSEEQIEQYRKDFWSGVNNRTLVSECLLSERDVFVVEYEGRKILIIYVPQAQREQRPVYKMPDPFQGTYKRNFEGDFKCSPKEVKQMMADSDASRPEDGTGRIHGGGPSYVREGRCHYR